MGELVGGQRTATADLDVEGAAGPAFPEFFEGESERLLRALIVVTGDPHEAEDIAQEAFTRVLARWERVSAMDDPAGYLHRTAMNVLRSRYRRAKVALQRAVTSSPTADVFETIELRDTAMHVLSTLTPRQRAALVLTEAFGYSGEETARMLGIKATTVWALTHQARASLQRTSEAHDD
jgi:RNA polymerase sigma factor (sigma-70 family)